MRDIQDLRLVEMAAAGVLSAGIVYIGIALAGLLALMSVSVSKFSLMFAGT